MPQQHTNDYPLWAGPCGAGPLGGITQSMLVRFLSCRERFRLKYVLGLEPPDRWNHRIGYGNMWHVCEEAMAKGLPVPKIIHGEPVRESAVDVWSELSLHAQEMCRKYPMQQEEITKWYNVAWVQFPEYAKYWSEHPDVKNRKPIMQEEIFDVPYTLPSGRTVRLRGKFDSVDLIIDEVTGPNGGIYLQENKTKGDVDKMQVERQLKFDLQTMLYLIALADVMEDEYPDGEYPIFGVRYNVVRRPLSGGKGSIKPHETKSTRKTYTPAESATDFYERLRRDYLAAEPDYWFFRVRAEVSARDIQVFRDTCLDPLLEEVCDWYERVTCLPRCIQIPKMRGLHYRTPFGVYSALEEGGATEYDAYLENGSEAGLRRVESLFPELQ